MLRSVRFRVTALAAVVFATLLTVAGSVLLAVQRDQLTDALDASLRRQVDDLVATVVVDLDLDEAHLPIVLANQSGDDAVVQLVDGDGAVIAGTGNAVDLPPIGVAPSGGIGSERTTTVETLPIEDDHYRILSRSVDVDGGGRAVTVVHVASNTDDVDGVLDQLRRALIVIVPLATLLLSAMVWWLIGRTLRPVEAIRAEVADLGSSDLARRVPRPGTGDEIDELAATMNEMLDRLEQAAERQQRFVADASHELRSPLARMRAELDVDAEVPDAARSSLTEEIDAMAALIDDLLALAASDAHATIDTSRPVDLDDIVVEEVGALRTRTDVVIDMRAVGAANVGGDPGQLRRVVRNLLDNAVRHAGGSVTVSLREHDETVTLTVADDGPGVPVEHAASVFDRFARVDEARTREAGGSGLGLAICRDIVERHGGSIALDGDGGPGARFVVDLPRRAARPR